MTMWNEDDMSASAGEYDDGASAQPHGYDRAPGYPQEDLSADVVWSPEQMTRLEGEWRRLQRAFAYHPIVTLIPRKGDPPHEYEVHYRVTTLAVDPAGQLDYVQQVGIHIWLPPGFPEQPPLVRPLIGVFHPNVSYEGFYLTGAWHPAETLLNLVRKIGDLLAYRIYDPESVVNPTAQEWMEANAHTLPTDAQADFSPGAGGDALGRICRYGQQTLDTIRQSVLEMQKALLSFDAPEPGSVRDFVYRTRLGLNLYLENDVPDNLRSTASALDECARETPGDLPYYDYLRGRRAAVLALRAATKAVNDALLPLGMQLDKLSGLVEEEPTEALIALRMIPEAKVLQPSQMALPKLVSDGGRKVVSVRQQLDSMAKTRVPQYIPSDTMLAQRLEKEFEKVAAELSAAQREAREALEQFEPVLARAKLDQAALERIARWREYVDMISRARGLERRVAEWGSEGVQAYYIENESGNFGPFQFEQPVDLGSGDLVVRNQMRGSVEVRIAKSETVLGHSNDGKITVDVPAAGSAGEEGLEEALGGDENAEGAADKPAKTYATTFQLTERCDDLLVQLDFLRRQTADTLKTFDKTAIQSEIWCGKFCALLASPESQKALEKELSKVSYRWRQTMVDLAALSPLKERLATYFLLQRVHETAPPLVRLLKESKDGLKASEKRLAEIARHCSRDVENDRLVVPPKYTERYEKEMEYRRVTGKKIRESSALLKSMAMQLMARLKDAKSLGKAGIPAMRSLPAVPETLSNLPLADGELGEMIVELEGLIGTPLGGPRPAPRAPEPVPQHQTEEESGASHEVAAEGRAETGGDVSEPTEHAHEETQAAADAQAPSNAAPSAEPAAVSPAPLEAPSAAPHAAGEATPHAHADEAAGAHELPSDDDAEAALPFFTDDFVSDDAGYPEESAEGEWAEEDFVAFDAPAAPPPPPLPATDATRKPAK